MTEGANLLDDLAAFLCRFVAYPSDAAAVAHTLWIAHAHLMDAWESTPRIAFLSPEPGSGKTRALEVTSILVPSAVEAINVTPAYLFRKVGDQTEKPTILFDECDTVFGAKTKDNSEEIRGLLNAGHRRGAVAGRCRMVGKKVETEEIPAYCAVALAGIGDLPDTILTRSVVIQMRRRRPDEQVEPYRRRVHAPEGELLRSRLASWASETLEAVTDVWPEMPEGIEDRNADVWEPLLAVADAAGGEWPKRGRVSAVTLVTLSREVSPSLGVRLLGDLRTVFGDETSKSTASILAALNGMKEAPWGDIRGKPLDDRGLARRLSAYGVKPKVLRNGETTHRGYYTADLQDAWLRYLAPLSPLRNSVTTVTSETVCAQCGKVESEGDPLLKVTDGNDFKQMHRSCVRVAA